MASEGDYKVLLLEAGYSNKHPLLDMPPGIFKMINGTKYMRYHKTVAQPHLNNRVHEIPQGHVLGGGSSVNAQVYMRGRPADYDDWHSELRGSNDGVDWDWNAVLPHFRNMEDNNRLNNDLHGSGGALLVSDPGHVDHLSRLFVKSVQGLGEPFTPDFNGKRQRGVGFYQFMNRNGRRSSAAYAYITPQESNPNLTIRLQAEVHSLVIENDTAIGVKYADKSGRIHTVHCTREVVLAAGSLITPKILMLSGIGPREHLEDIGITCKNHLAGVGQNLIDHPEVPITARVKGKHGYYKQGEGWRMLKNGLQFKMFGSGPITSAGVEAGAFVNPTSPNDPPTIQAFCVPIVYVDRDTRDLVQDGYGLTVTTVVVKPKSRGTVKLASANPKDMPLVSPNLLKHSDDMDAMIEGQKFFLRAFDTMPLSEHVDRVMLPDPKEKSDEALRNYCKRFVKTNYHPAGTARMGKDGDPMAVLDPRMRVRGIKGLRVCDLSAMPNINAGNTQAPAMMMGDRCADIIMGHI
ncbi:glucose-methanol-choline oxidoreductase [Amylibacter marinus]|uniref:Glucose-methanol-choline oxidoreductase n=1 Tax=Amylibacter marinus TaxID=1475483 RepID=A0ABQ5VXQ3_9RHOB|nr:glucose-methanol-choline oxidoreductase [Amylibacter marinus]